MFLVFLLFCHRLGDRDLWSSHEARAAQNAQSILSDGCWALPHLFDGKLELQKPPLYYWLVAGIAWLRGGAVDAWSVRLPATVSALTCLLVVHGFVAQRRGRRVGLVAAAILATMLHFTWMARIGRIDMPLTLAVSAALLAYFEAFRAASAGRPAGKPLLAAYLSAALAVMLKGPIGLVLPVAVIALHLLVELAHSPFPVLRSSFFMLLAPTVPFRFAHLAFDFPRYRSSFRTPGAAFTASGSFAPSVFASRSPLRALRASLCWGLPVLLILTVPWFCWANLRTDGELFRCFFWYHNVERAFGGGGLRWHPWWFYGPRLAIDLLPWSVLLPVALYWLCRTGWRADAEARFAATWLFAMLLVLSCAHFKRADYLLPAYPAAALLIACWLGQTRNKKHEIRNKKQETRNEEETDARCQALRGSVSLDTSLQNVEASPRGLSSFLVSCFLFLVFLPALGWGYYVERVLPADEPAREMHSFADAIRRMVPAPGRVIFFRVESHALAFHLGPQIDTVLEWENLDIWAGRPGQHYIVMPPKCAGTWQDHVSAGKLEVLFSNSDLADRDHEHPLVLLRSGAR